MLACLYNSPGVETCTQSWSITFSAESNRPISILTAKSNPGKKMLHKRQKVWFRNSQGNQRWNLRQSLEIEPMITAAQVASYYVILWKIERQFSNSRVCIITCLNFQFTSLVPSNQHKRQDCTLVMFAQATGNGCVQHGDCDQIDCILLSHNGDRGPRLIFRNVGASRQHFWDIFSLCVKLFSLKVTVTCVHNLICIIITVAIHKASWDFWYKHSGSTWPIKRADYEQCKTAKWKGHGPATRPNHQRCTNNFVIWCLSECFTKPRCGLSV